ncbi:MAG: UDP-N-acetylmuramate dehydrogenase [Acidimicrobiia bacterium]
MNAPNPTGLPEVADRLRDAIGDGVTLDVPARELTTYRLGGPVAVLVRAREEAHLLALAEALAGTDVPVLAIGRGSNLVVADEGFPGVGVLLEGSFETLDLPPEPAGASPGDGVDVAAGGSVPLPVLARRCAAAGITGLEFYVGIPGSVGGAVRMNAGGHGQSTHEVLGGARVVDLVAGTVSDRSVPALGLGYRTSALRAHEIVVAATFRGATDDPGACDARLGEIVRWRRDNQPGGSNAGSVFTNPPDDSAGRLIDACGLKGLRVGGVEVSHKHANFFQADDGATAADVRALVETVRRVVHERTGVELRPELVFVGDGPGAGDGRNEP